MTAKEGHIVIEENWDSPCKKPPPDSPDFNELAYIVHRLICCKRPIVFLAQHERIERRKLETEKSISVDSWTYRTFATNRHTFAIDANQSVVCKSCDLLLLEYKTTMRLYEEKGPILAVSIA